MKILVVEPYGVLRVALALNFTEMGYTVVAEAANYQQAEQSAAGEQPNLCVIGVFGIGEHQSLELASTLFQRHGIPSLLLTDRYGQPCPRGAGVIGSLIVPQDFASFTKIMRLVQDHLTGRRVSRMPACLCLTRLEPCYQPT